MYNKIPLDETSDNHGNKAPHKSVWPLNGKKKVTKKKRSSITLALDKDVLEIIRSEAKSESISINAKINNILSKFAFFYSYAEKSGSSILMSKTTDFVVENIDEEKWIQEMKRVVMDAYPILMLEQNGSLRLQSIITMLSKDAIYCGIYKGFAYHLDEEGYLNFVFRHERGIKWSRVLSEGYSHFLEKILNWHVQSTIFESGLIIKVLERDSQEIANLFDGKG